jgi:hypothetical protein
VKEVIAETGVLTIDAGIDHRLRPNDAFVMYVPVINSPTPACGVFKTVGYGHAVSVDAVSSTLLLDQNLDSRGVKEGDIVMVRRVEKL